MKMKNYLLIAVLIICSIFIKAQSNMFLGTPEHLGLYHSNFPEKVILKKSWNIKTEGKIFGTASAANGIVYFGSDDSCLYAVEKNGNQNWKIKLNGKIRSTPAIKDSVLFIHDYSGRIYALNCKDGSEIWYFDSDGEARFADYGINGNQPKDKMLEDPWDVYLASPIYKDSAVYFACGKNLYALDLKTGTKYWNFAAENIMHSSPALSNGILYVGCWNSKIYAVNATNGEKIWEFQTGLDPVNHLMAGIQSSPTVSDSIVFIGSRDANVYALHANTGKQLWKAGFGGSWMPSSFTVVGDTVYTGSSDATSFYALDKKTGKTIFSNKLPAYAFSTPAYSNGTLFIGCGNGSMFCADAKTGKIKARFDTDGHRHNYLHALNPDGSINFDVFPNSPNYEENVRWCEILFSTGTVFTSPLIMDNMIFFGSSDSTFYAIEDDGSEKPDFENATSKLEFNGIKGTNAFDTLIAITNHSTVEDSVFVNTYKSFSKFKKGISFEPSQLTLLPGETKSIRLKGSMDFATLSPFKTTFSISSARNEYIQNEISFEVKISTSVNQNSEASLLKVFPNPAHGNASFEYTLPESNRIEIAIYNNLNQEIKRLYAGNQLAGSYRFSTDLGNLASGVYYFSIKKGAKREVVSFVKE